MKLRHLLKRQTHVLLAALLLGFAIGATPVVRAADWHHVHLTVPETKKAAEWYAKLFGGEVSVTAGFDTAVFGNTLVRMRRGRGETLGSQGSVIDHIGFSVRDLESKFKEFEEAGIKIARRPTEFRGLKISFIEDPWGTRIEVVQDSDLYGFHHVHLAVSDPDEALAWFTDLFGGRRSELVGLPAIRYEGMLLLATRARGETAPTTGRSVDHIGFSFSDFDAGVAKAREKKAKFLMEPRQAGDHRIAFIEGPGGVKIELYELK